MVKNKFNRAIHNELLCTSMENRLTVITHFLCKKGIYINNNNNKHKAINADINRYYRRIQLLKLKK